MMQFCDLEDGLCKRGDKGRGFINQGYIQKEKNEAINNQKLSSQNNHFFLFQVVTRNLIVQTEHFAYLSTHLVILGVSKMNWSMAMTYTV